MKYIITYWDYKKLKFNTIELEGESERDGLLSYFKRNGWVKKNGVWHSPKENG